MARKWFTTMLLQDNTGPRTASGPKAAGIPSEGLGIEVLRHLNARNALFAHFFRAIGATVKKRSLLVEKNWRAETANGDAPRSLSSNPSPERIDEKVGGESPLIDEHTGSGGIRYSA